jgi:hypothetical protein
VSRDSRSLSLSIFRNLRASLQLSDIFLHRINPKKKPDTRHNRHTEVGLRLEYIRYPLAPFEKISLSPGEVFTDRTYMVGARSCGSSRAEHALELAL